VGKWRWRVKGARRHGQYGVRRLGSPSSFRTASNFLAEEARGIVGGKGMDVRERLRSGQEGDSDRGERRPRKSEATSITRTTTNRTVKIVVIVNQLQVALGRGMPKSIPEVSQRIRRPSNSCERAVTSMS
jgi:hypothetical protein